MFYNAYEKLEHLVAMTTALAMTVCQIGSVIHLSRYVKYSFYSLVPSFSNIVTQERSYEMFNIHSIYRIVCDLETDPSQSLLYNPSPHLTLVEIS